ncbi:hypothetical protein RGV33_10690 [Pseudomonas sp. Bout1]|uniref:hypothetical protein n=1 Tax=Pseudomonas sp. Bout1 TaxID=3048600 RepID=UPI002AB50325|nr:hypothetical protein [Pseudomonas sp. Bout1]MDY7532149.1 hypothetical protein [Pseudomonas sp. Bout1]MEB0188832.1 hypothetical protein [Pseudomonas sp. Bout1]
MNICRFIPLFLGCLLPQLCTANTPPIDPHAERLYQQALPYLQRANTKLEAVPANFPTASADEKKRSQALVEEAGESLKPAIKLLEQAAALDHPVAQHRLAMIYVLFYPIDVIKEKACPLLERSFLQGFAPPALQLSSFCYELTNTPEFQTTLKAIATSTPAYEQYFPQPAVKLECRAEMPQGMALQWGSSRDYQAEMYRLLGDSNRAQRTEYYQQAIAINDCYKAKKRLGLSQ